MVLLFGVFHQLNSSLFQAKWFITPLCSSQGKVGEIKAGDGVNPVTLFKVLDSILTPQSLLIGDGGDFVGTAARILRPRSPLSWLDPGAFGTLGVGGGFALAKPVIFKGAAKKFPAYLKWTDTYLQSLPQSKDYSIFLEEGKKENRGDGSRRESFYNFLNIYKSLDVYCVNEIPPFMRGDVPVPRSIACPFLLDSLMIDNVMWFSSGGTKSVWHNDGFENINCLFRGEKTFILADRAETTDRAHIDIRDGSYSTVDVENVDLKNYPGLGEIQFYRADMDAGDCLYVPFLWFHHVSSVGSNLAANIWWQSYRTEMKCEDQDMPDLTIADLKFMGADDTKYSLADRAHLALYTDDYMYNHNHSTQEVFLEAIGQVLDDTPGYEHGELIPSCVWGEGEYCSPPPPVLMSVQCSCYVFFPCLGQCPKGIDPG
eukprot:sb/3464934/